MLMRELKKIDTDLYRLKLSHWHIQSGNKEAFKMNDVLYESISIIISPDMEYWYCAKNGDESARQHGGRRRTIEPKVITTLHGLAAQIAKLKIKNPDTKPTVSVKPPSKNDNKCTDGKCANNCIYCRKYISPFAGSVKSKCACYIEKKLKRIEENDESDSSSASDDIALRDLVVINNLGRK